MRPVNYSGLILLARLEFIFQAWRRVERLDDTEISRKLFLSRVLG